MANQYQSQSGLLDPAMEEFRAIVRVYGTLMTRDSLLDEIHPRRERRTGMPSREHYTTLNREMVTPRAGGAASHPPHHGDASVRADGQHGVPHVRLLDET